MSRRRFDPSALIAGVLFLGVAGRYLAAGLAGHPVSYAWTMPAVVAVVVVTVLLRVMFHSRRRER